MMTFQCYSETVVTYDIFIIILKYPFHSVSRHIFNGLYRCSYYLIVERSEKLNVRFIVILI
jgi:hypothetical protein